MIDVITMKWDIRQFLLETFPHAAVLITVTIVLTLSLIPTYLPVPSIDLDNSNNNIVVSPSTLNMSFNIDIDDLAKTNALSLIGLKVVNTDDLTKQLTSAFHLRSNAIKITMAEFQELSHGKTLTKRSLVACHEIGNNGLVFIMAASINYRLCGNAGYCKMKLYNEVIQSIDTYQNDPLRIRLQLNNNEQISAKIRKCHHEPNLCASKKFPNLNDASIDELQTGLRNGLFTSVDLVKAYLARIDEVNKRGPALHAVIETSPTALEAARKADSLRKKGIVLSILHGIPILLKDNIATRSEDGMNTTAGSYALLGRFPLTDATVVKKLRDAGAILLGKTTLSEWANFRGTDIPNGWSARGQQATSPFYPQGDACGSSTGSGIAAAIGLAAGTLGTETDGSIICPSNRNNLVGIKPTVGLTSRNLVIPISQSQDSIGPMCRSVADVAAILSIIAGRDHEDIDTLSQSVIVPDYTEYLNKNALKGARIGVLRSVFVNSTFGGYPDYIISEFNRTIEQTFKRLGATIIDPADLNSTIDITNSSNEFTVLLFEFKAGINQYLSKLQNSSSGVKTLADLIEYNRNHSNLELPPGRANQDLFIWAEDTTNLNDPAYIAAVKSNRDRGGEYGIDAILKTYQLDALIAPSEGYTSTLPAIAGYPIITVPLGFLPQTIPVKTNENTTVYNLPIWPAPNFPFGLSFIGAAFTEARLIELAYSYEQATLINLHGKPFDAAIPKTQLSDIICSP